MNTERAGKTEIQTKLSKRMVFTPSFSFQKIILKMNAPEIIKNSFDSLLFHNVSLFYFFKVFKMKHNTAHC